MGNPSQAHPQRLAQRPGKPAASSAAASTGNLETVARLHGALGRASRLLRESASGGLTPTQLAVLGALLRDGPRQLNELAAAERINPTLLSRVVGRLEDDGLVQRAASEQDRRAYLVTITVHGKQLAEGVRRDRCRALAEHVTELDPAEAAALFAAVPALESLASALSAGSPQTGRAE